MASLTYAYLLATLFVAGSLQSEFLPCDNLPAPKSAVISACKTLPCSFRRGSSVEAAIEFAATADTSTLKPEVDVQVGDLHVKYPLPRQNACEDLQGAECPLEKGEVAVYKLKMPIEKVYPKISLTIQLSLVDEHKNTQMCIRIPAKVVD